MPSDQAYSRRRLLQAVLIGVAGGTAGCNDRSTPATTSTAPPPTGTPTDEQTPTILDYAATPEQNGTLLTVSMEGEDDRGLDTARISYGDRELVREPDGTTVTVDGTLQDTAATSPEDGRVAYVLTDAAGNATRKHVQPDDTAPELAVKTRSTKNAGEAILTITAEDVTGLAEVHNLLDGEAVQNLDTVGSTEYSDEHSVSVSQKQRFQRTPVGGRATDWNGNATEKQVGTYVRKYNLLEETRLDIGAVYISQQGDAFRRGCRDSYEGIEPTVGIYDEDPIPTEVTTKHVDQMTGHGINRLVYDYAGYEIDGKQGRVEALLDSSLIDQIEIEPFYTPIGLVRRQDEHWQEVVLPEDLTYLRDTVLTGENVATIDDRPVVSTWNFTYLLSNDETSEKVRTEFGSFEAFVDEMRRHLRVDGTDPFLVVGKGPSLVADDTRLGDFVDLFDGMTTWFPPGPWRQGEDDSWDAITDRVETYFQNNHQYATDHDMEFTPRVFPGYDDRGSGCGREGDKHFPRRTERFRQLLELAEQYTTRDRIDVATWNGWIEGHQIEPGTFKGTDYGTDYLEVVQQFQRGEE